MIINFTFYKNAKQVSDETQRSKQTGGEFENQIKLHRACQKNQVHIISKILD